MPGLDVSHSAMLGNLSRSDGSALIAAGETVIQASVNGPSEIKLSKELPNKALIDVTVRPKVGMTVVDDRASEYFVRNSFESTVLTALHPRTSINIVLEELQIAGNVLASYVNASYLALLDAGISMNGTVTAVSLGVFHDEIVPFPNKKKMRDAKCMITICIKHPGEYIVGTVCSSFLQEEELKKCIAIAKQYAKDLSEIYKECVEKKYLKSS